jgi:anti-sigma28 factor (negative regulator of flagellin synthesis)
MWKSVERARSFSDTEETENVKRIHVEALRERIRGHRYEVDTEQVAGAVLHKLNEAREQRAVRLRARSQRVGAPSPHM